MPDNSPHGSAPGQPDSHSSEAQSNAQSNAPRIAPPEGVRAARGTNFEAANSEIDTDSEAVLETAPPPSIIEDSYEPPLDFESESAPFEDDIAPISEPVSPGGQGAARPDTPKDVELGLMQHLGELRQRLLYCALILVAGMALTWNYSGPMQEWFANPIRDVIKGKGTLISTDPTGFFSITVQFSLVSALILTAPLLFWQVWRFIEPALTNSERKYSLVIVPFSSALFFLGAALAYAVSPLFFKFFLAFQIEGVAANWNYYDSVILMAKMLLAFGIMFQVPVVVIFLNKLGFLSRNILIEYWRHAVVGIFTLAAIVTPTWDPVTLAVCATPPCLLYVLSIWLVKWL